MQHMPVLACGTAGDAGESMRDQPNATERRLEDVAATCSSILKATLASNIGVSIIWPLPRALAVQQRGENAVDHRHAGDLVAERDRQVSRLAARLLHEAGHARAGLDHVVIGGLAAIGSAFAETVGAAIDDVRPHLP